MFILVTGGSASGKSEYAENLLHDSKNENARIYIATMQPFGQEAQKRIEKHRKQRADKGFDTIECYRNLHEIELPDNCDVLLECMSNLTANEMFSDENVNSSSDIELLADKIITGVKHVIHRCDNMVIVTNEVFSDTLDYDKTTKDYIRFLGIVNQRLAELADRVVEVVYGIPIEHKKDE